MKKKILLVIVLILATAVYFVFKEDTSWKLNNKIRTDISIKEFPDLDRTEFLLDNLKAVNYMAIVYPKAITTSHNSWFHKYILPSEEFSSAVKADVEFTIYGEEYEEIEYGSTLGGLDNYPLVVALCKTDAGLYALDQGYEFPATIEFIEYAKTLKTQITDENVSLNCGGQLIK